MILYIKFDFNGVSYMKTIFVVDDNTVNLLSAEAALSGSYNVVTLSSAELMFRFLEKTMPDLILLDILMPEMDGFAALKQLQNSACYSKIPVIFLTGKNDPETEALGLEMGVVDFIAKPFSEPVLLNRIKTHLHIEEIIRERTENLTKLKNSIISVLANMVENRDTITGNHIERTTRYVKKLLDAILERGMFADETRDWDIDLIISSARLHDIGKISISDLILNKPEKLTNEEFEIIKTHASEGERIINSIINDSGYETFLHYAKLFAGYHHERWDGKGYPHGLAGKDIPLQGRIMGIADVYDALVSTRPYKKAFTHGEAVRIITDGRGTQFDPELIDIFADINGQFEETALCR
jgi:putative two-component system response regulator